MSIPVHKREVPQLKTFWRWFCWQRTKARNSTMHV